MAYKIKVQRGAASQAAALTLRKGRVPQQSETAVAMVEYRLQGKAQSAAEYAFQATREAFRVGREDTQQRESDVHRVSVAADLWPAEQPIGGKTRDSI
jgi:hypothetical protein